jgi:DNA-binding MarR family transcriptional regulator
LVGVAARSLEELPRDMTLAQFRALVLLSTRGRLAMGELAEAMRVHPSTTTRLVDRLDAKRMVRRQARDGDRRQITIQLTRRGKVVVDRVTAARRRSLAAIVECLSEHDRRTVERGMERFASAAGEFGDESWELGWAEE